MRRKKVIVLGLGTGMALLVMAAIGKGKSPASPVPTVKILVATRDIDAGRTLSTSDYNWESWPQNAVPGSALHDNEKDRVLLESARMRLGVKKGEPILNASLVQQDKTKGFLAASLEPGKRAISIPVSVKTSVGGFVRPGDFVDIILTYEVKIDDSDQQAQNIVARRASETVLQAVRVLAVDQEVANNRDAGPVRTVTVEVSQPQAEKIMLAQEMGTLNLSLRSIDLTTAQEQPNNHHFTSDLDVGRALRAATMAARGGAGMPSGDTSTIAQPVRIYQGSQMTQFNVPDGPKPGVGQ